MSSPYRQQDSSQAANYYHHFSRFIVGDYRILEVCGIGARIVSALVLHKTERRCQLCTKQFGHLQFAIEHDFIARNVASQQGSGIGIRAMLLV